ncbi:MAG: serpin family protein [Desulfobacteraceae bacterium]|nr:serpin family protein [Desulfobacteraceae bacterium]
MNQKDTIEIAEAIYKSALSSFDAENPPDVPVEDLEELAAGNKAFALDLYQVLSEGQDNLLFSPYNISSALAMLYAGAKNNTETQMADTLHFTLAQDSLHPAFYALASILASREEEVLEDDDQLLQLNIANAAWMQDGFNFLPDYLDVLASNYGSGLNLLDFTSDPEACREVINTWVAEQTEDKIKDLIPSGILNTLTRLVLSSAIYFYSTWEYAFDEEQTQSGTFQLADGSSVQADMMNQTQNFNYAEGDGYQAVELKYSGEQLSMILLLPETEGFDEFEAALDQFDEIVGSMQEREVKLTMPKFEYEYDISLKETLKAMGMTDPFSMEDADFSGITIEEPISVAEIIHKAFISVSESGTEAAAATAIIVATDSVPPPPVEMVLDRPFIFFIRDIPTKTILFTGRVMNPS